MKNCLRWLCATAVFALLAAGSGHMSNAQTGQPTGAPPAAPTGGAQQPAPPPQTGEQQAPPAAPPAEAAKLRAFDGVWSVVIYTTRGDCDRALRYSLRIVNGRAVSTDRSYQAFGKVAADGAIRVTVSEGGRSAGGAGHLVGNTGRGEWRTANGRCRGQWRAVRRGREY